MNNAITKVVKTSVQKQQFVMQNCKNKLATEELIEQYQNSTKSAIEQILNMGVAVNEINKQFKSEQLNKYDVNYFCMSVGISHKSSTFRKYDAIGKNADKFKMYMNKLPTAFSVLYEIATLESDLFEEIFINSDKGANITLKELRAIANKNSNVPTKNKSPNESSFKVIFNLNKISPETKRIIGDVFKDLMNLKDIEVEVPKHSQSVLSYHRLKLAA
jgi:hypothetical protein